jgi:hypothetical protein
MATLKTKYSGGSCESGVTISFSGLTILKPNNTYFISFYPINSIPSGYTTLNPPYYFLKPINEEPDGFTVSTYGRFLTNYSLDNSSSNIIELSIYDANNKSVFTVDDIPIYRERRHIKCGNLCGPSGLPNYSGEVAARLPSRTPTNTPTPTITPTISITPSITPTITITPTTTRTPTPTPSSSSS